MAEPVPQHDGLVIAEIASLKELAEYQEVECYAWGLDSVQESVPGHVTLTHQRYGGLLLGAREPEGRMVGMLLGFPGLKAGRLIHCSHMLGVVPDWRGRDVGYRMKLWQRQWATAQGLDLVVWTYDPLETRNARLNLSRLGGICREYHPNLYGVMNDGLNQGMESDRLVIEWHILHPAVAARLAGETRSPNPLTLLADGVPLLTRTVEHPSPEGGAPLRYLADTHAQTGATLLIEAPTRFQSIKQADLGAAHAWRMGLRTLMMPLFAQGYAALDILYDAAANRCYYLLGPMNEYLSRSN